MTTELPRPQIHDPVLSAEERELGMDRDITRRDFINSVALGTGTALLGTAAPSVVKALSTTEPPAPNPLWHPWTGYGGEGDYAISNGNTWDVVNAGHGIRDGLYESSIASAGPTGETYDLVIVGGGFAGTIAAYTFMKETRRERPVLLLDNHPIIGGEAKRNEFVVRGQRLIGAQGSNATDVPAEGWAGALWQDIGLPTAFEFAELSSDRRPLEFPLDNNVTMGMEDLTRNRYFGQFFDTPRPHWVTDPWARNLENTPWPHEIRKDLLRWRDEPARPFYGDESALERWLDSITYEHYLTEYRGLHPEVARYADLQLTGEGMGSDVLSACLAYRSGQPGFKGLSKQRDKETREWEERAKAAEQARDTAASRIASGFSFPGGNDGIMRGLVKWLNPEVIEGTSSFGDVHNGRIRFDAMDKPGATCRMRAGATVVRVDHDPGSQGKGKLVKITYVKDGQFHSVQTRAVIWAAASWSGKHVIQNLPDDYRAAMDGFPRSPALVVNVALNNWRALYKLGYTSCAWRGGFGFWGTIRAPMYIGNYRPPLDPDQPTIFTFKVMFPEIGLSLLEQGRVGRAKLYATSYREFETQIRRQFVTLFANAGFDPKRDIAGIVLNRWGHAYVNCGPGFFFGRGGRLAPSDVLRRPLGNVSFGHSELQGIQSWWGAGEEGIRAANQAIAMLYLME